MKKPPSKRRHYVIAAEALGYRVPKSWRVHHLNYLRGDHRPENLVVCDSERTFTLLTTCPEVVLPHAKWLGAPGQSVRLLEKIEPPGERICVRCLKLLPIASFCFWGAGHKCPPRWYCRACA